MLMGDSDLDSDRDCCVFLFQCQSIMETCSCNSCMCMCNSVSYITYSVSCDVSLPFAS